MNTLDVTGDWDRKYRAWKKEHEKKAYKVLPTIKSLKEFPKKREPIDKEATYQEQNPMEERNYSNNIKTSKFIIFSAGIIIILAILGIIFYLNYDPSKIRYKYIDIEAKNVSGLPISVYYKTEQLFSFSGWESMFTMENKDRLFGNEQYKRIIFDARGKAYTQITLDDQIRIEPLSTDPIKATTIGWFTSLSDLIIKDKLNKNNKEVIIYLDTDKLNSNITFKMFKNKLYFLVLFSAEAEDNSELGDFALGFVAPGYDIYLPNGTVLLNDNNITSLDKPLNLIILGNITSEVNESLTQKISPETLSKNSIERKGTYSPLQDLEYEIFYNNRTGFIVFSGDEFNDFENLFQWNVFRIYASHLENKYPDIYFIVLDNASLTYNEESSSWNIKDKYFNGLVDDYIIQVKEELWNSG